MGGRKQAHGRLSAGFLLLLVLPTPAFTQPAEVRPSSGATPGRIRLSEAARLTLALEGPAPLRVDLPDKPEQLLTPEVAAAWRIQAAGPPAVTPLTEGRERWVRVYRVDKWDERGPNALAFGPVKVTAGANATAQDVTWAPVTIEVLPATPGRAEDARPVSGIEELPPVPAPQTDPAAVGGWLAAGLGAVFAAAVAVVLVRRSRAGTLPPSDWAARELDRLGDDLAAGRMTGADAADRVAAVVREFTVRRYGLPAPKRTTTELLAECDRAGWPADRVGPLRELLERCDRAKFAGGEPASGEARTLIAQARAWVAAAAPVPPAAPAPYTADT